MAFTIPLIIGYNGRKMAVTMGPFNHSAEREFSLISAKQSVDNCNDLGALKERTKALVDAFGAMQTALQEKVLENLKLSHTVMARDRDLQAASDLLDQAIVFSDVPQWWLQLGRTIFRKSP